MESYKDFIKRVEYQERGLSLGEGYFHPDRNRVFPKVGEDGNLKPFYGDTVVFDLDDELKSYAAGLRDRLYEAAPLCFAQPLSTSTIHMTLHDLSSSENLAEAAPLCFENEVKLIDLQLSGITPEPIQMKTNFIVNMVSTSLVLTLLPQSEREWDKLEGLYRAIDGVRVCPYPFLTPHITLAYFNRHGFDMSSAEALKAAAYELNGDIGRSVALDPCKLVYQKFTSMGKYYTVFPLFCGR